MKVLLPGSYDPVTAGHLDVIARAAALFSEVHAVIFINPEKHCLFSLEDRLFLLTLACRDLKNVRIAADDGMVIDYAERHGITLAVKGIRNEHDAAYEQKMADYNRTHGKLETLFLPAAPAFAAVSSTALRDALAAGDDLSPFLPPHMTDEVKELYRKTRGRCAHE